MPSQCLPLVECDEVQAGTECVLVALMLFTTSSFSLGPVLAGCKGISPARLPQVHSITANLSLPRKLLLPWEWAWSPRPAQACTAQLPAQREGARPAGRGNESGEAAHTWAGSMAVLWSRPWGRPRPLGLRDASVSTSKSLGLLPKRLLVCFAPPVTHLLLSSFLRDSGPFPIHIHIFFFLIHSSLFLISFSQV